MKARITSKELSIIKDKVERYNGYTFYFGQLSLGMVEKLKKYFKVKKETTGFYLLEKL